MNALTVSSPKDRLILALDVPSADAAKEIVNELDDLVSFYKVGLELFTAAGMEIVSWLIERDKRVFLDIKWLDISNTIASVVRIASEQGVSLATLDGNGDGDMMRAAAEARGGDLHLVSVTALTSHSDATISGLDDGFTSVQEKVRFRAKEAIKNNLDGVICSGQEAAMVRSIADEQNAGGFLVVTPGMRLAGGSQDDHRRAGDPGAAVRDGANFIVVGRPIRGAGDRRAAAQRFIDAIESGPPRPAA